MINSFLRYAKLPSLFEVHQVWALSRVQSSCIKGHQTVMQPQQLACQGAGVLYAAAATYPCPSVQTQTIIGVVFHGETKMLSPSHWNFI